MVPEMFSVKNPHIFNADYVQYVTVEKVLAKSKNKMTDKKSGDYYKKSGSNFSIPDIW